MKETLNVDINAVDPLNVDISGSRSLNGNINENIGGSSYVLPIASENVLGGIKVGENLTIEEDGTLNAQAGGTIADSTIFYKDGDTFRTYAPFNANGLITSAAERVCFTVSLPKRLDNINLITCDFLHAELRGLNGYLNDASGYKEYTNDANYTITCTKSADNLVSIILNNPSGFSNVPNNTPIIVRLQLILTFHEKA
jgi:hypothetical protein